MNADIQTSLSDARQALHAGDRDAATRAFLDAGDCAVKYQLWRSAQRAPFRSALELDLVDRVAVGRLVDLGGRLRSTHADWTAYAAALEARDWPHFSSLNAQIVMDDHDAVIECPGIGRVIEIGMSAGDRFDAMPDRQMVGMPLGMMLIVLRHALWPMSREWSTTPVRVEVVHGGDRVWLDELGDWERV